MKKSAVYNKKGFTLVELIVTFAMIGIFITSATVLIGSAIRIHSRVTNLTKAQTVADTIMETIIGETAGALNAPVPENAEGTACLIEKGSGDKDRLYYTDKNGNPVTLYVDAADGSAGLLKLQYTGLSEADWYYGAETYMNNYISKLQFEQLEGENLIRVTLGLRNKSTGYEFEMSRIVECYNLTGEVIQSVP